MAYLTPSDIREGEVYVLSFDCEDGFFSGSSVDSGDNRNSIKVKNGTAVTVISVDIVNDDICFLTPDCQRAYCWSSTLSKLL